jgi:hypothetical protein
VSALCFERDQQMISFGSVDNPAAVKVLNSLAARLQPGRIDPIRPHRSEDSTCEHCGEPIIHINADRGWEHYRTYEKECHPRPAASPKRDTAGNVIPLTGK